MDVELSDDQYFPKIHIQGNIFIKNTSSKRIYLQIFDPLFT